MIPSARPTFPPVMITIFNWNLFRLLDFENWGRTDRQTNTKCEYSDHYRLWLWLGLVDHFLTFYVWWNTIRAHEQIFLQDSLFLYMQYHNSCFSIDFSKRYASILLGNEEMRWCVWYSCLEHYTILPTHVKLVPYFICKPRLSGLRRCQMKVELWCNLSLPRGLY